MTVKEKTESYQAEPNSPRAADENLARFKNEMQEKDIPVITDDALQLIRVLIQSHQIKSILEVGTAVGASAMLFASYTGRDGKITTIERDDNFYIRAVEHIKNMGFTDQIQVIHADAAEQLKKLEGPYDMIFLDGAKAHYIHMLNDCVRLLKTNGLLIADNVLFRGMVNGEQPVIRRKITIVKRLRKFLAAINERDDIVSSVLPVGDGLSISVKKY